MQILEDTEIEDMIGAGVHIGHSRTKRNPAMSPYIFGIRNNTEILDLVKTKEMLVPALNVIQTAAEQGKTILFVGTHPAARKILEEVATETGMPYVSLRWIGGTLTNFKVISKQIESLETLEREKRSGDFEKYTKKERMIKDEEIMRLKQNFGGIRLLKKLPDILFIINTIQDDLAVREARRMKIPVVALSDTNTNPGLVQYPIPSNDDALSAIRYMVGRAMEAVQEGKRNVQKKDETNN